MPMYLCIQVRQQLHITGAGASHSVLGYAVCLTNGASYPLARRILNTYIIALVEAVGRLTAH